MTNPNDPWARRPDQAPTEQLASGQEGAEPDATEVHRTSDYQAAYGQQPTTSYPGYGSGPSWGAADQHGSPGAPPAGPHGTQYIPTSGAPDYEYWQQPEGYPPGKPPGYRRSTGVYIGVGIAVVILVGAAGLAAGLLLGGRNSPPAAAPATTTTAPTYPAYPSQPPSGGQKSPFGIPGFPALPTPSGPGSSQHGGTIMGSITANDGATLTIDSLDGPAVTIRTTASTQVIALAGKTVADLPVGDLVLVQGDKSPDGSVQAVMIISASMQGGH